MTGTTDYSMSKKKPTNDQHKSGFMVRLPEIYRTQLRLLQKQERRSLTAEVILAVEKRLQEKGLWPPGTEQESGAAGSTS